MESVKTPPKAPIQSQAFSGTLPKKAKKKGNTPLLVGILVVLLGVSGYFYYPKIVQFTEGSNIVESQKKVLIKNVDWQKTVFDHPVFRSLRPVDSIPLDTNVGGGNPSPFTKKGN